jgi:hypothetical protein
MVGPRCRKAAVQEIFMPRVCSAGDRVKWPAELARAVWWSPESVDGHGCLAHRGTVRHVRLGGVLVVDGGAGSAGPG